MKKWQRFWLYGLITFSLAHLLRDVLQDLGVRNTFSTMMTKNTGSPVASFLGRTIIDTYIVAPVEIGLSIVSIYRRKFGLMGYLTIAIMVISVSAWLFYWFFL